MNLCAGFYSIRIQGSLHERWNNWFEGMTLTNLENGEILLQGNVRDQSELVGIINQVHNLNLKLLSVDCEQNQKPP